MDKLLQDENRPPCLIIKDYEQATCFHESEHSPMAADKSSVNLPKDDIVPVCQSIWIDVGFTDSCIKY